MNNLPKPKLLVQVSDLLRKKHYAYQTEKNYLQWIKRFILFHNKQHPCSLPKSAISDYLTFIAVKCNVSSSTQNQALNALVFLYREVIQLDIKELQIL